MAPIADANETRTVPTTQAEDGAADQCHDRRARQRQRSHCNVRKQVDRGGLPGVLGVVRVDLRALLLEEFERYVLLEVEDKKCGNGCDQYKHD